jgi:hypothetical protein
VRKLQALLSEREETLKVVEIEKSKLERHAETLESRIKSLDDSEQRFKEENWNLELVIQDLHGQQAEQKDAETKMQVTIAQLEHEKNMVIKELDDMKHQNAKLSEELVTEHKHHEMEIGTLRRTLATTDSDRTSLHQKVQDLRLELEESQTISMRLRSMQERQEEESRRSPLSLSPEEDDTPEQTPPPSPTKQTPRHGQLEAETLKSSLQHAHRLIQNLRSNIHREKTEKNELKRLLQDTRDELETARNGFSSPPAREKRRKPDGTFKKLPKANIALLGGARRSKDEVYTLKSPLVDDEWEEAHDDTDGHIRRTPGAYISSVPGTDMEGESAFETADERDSTDIYNTATENEETETEAYRTGAETPTNDNPTSADDMTETEDKSLKALRPKASALSQRSIRQMRMMKIRQRGSIVSTASTEDEGDEQYGNYRYPSSSMEPEDVYDHDDDIDDINQTPIAINNPRLKLRINRTRSKGSRNSDGSVFNSGMFSGVGSDSSPASLPDSPRPFESPRGGLRSSTAPDIRRSLFAELGNSPGMMSTDGESIDNTGTPSKRLSPSPMPKPEMVDCGVNTEEPYPEVPILFDDTNSERPSTAVTIVNDSTVLSPSPTFSRKPHFEPVKEGVAMSDAWVQSLEETRPSVSEMGTQSDEASTATTFETGTQFDPELENSEVPDAAVATVTALPAVEAAKETNDSGTQFDPKLEHVADDVPPVPHVFTIVTGEALETVPVEEEEEMQEPLVISQVAEEISPTFVLVKGTHVETMPMDELLEEEIVPEVLRPKSPALHFSAIASLSTTPVESISLTVPVPVPTDASVSSDDDTPKKVSETTEELTRPSTPVSSIMKGGLFASLFGPEKQKAGPEFVRTSAQKGLSLTSDDDVTIRKKDARSRPALPVPTSDQSVQTELSSDFIDKVTKDAQSHKKAVVTGIFPEQTSSRSRSTSITSRPSMDSINRGRGGFSGESLRMVPMSSMKRRGSSTSIRDQQTPPLPDNHQEQIAAAQQSLTASAPSPMGPPPIPTQRSNVSFRPRTPGQQDQSRRPETPSSRGGFTPKGPKFSAIRSELSSPVSRRSSLSSFASELDDRFGMTNENYPRNNGDTRQTDPKVIQAITQTMIGEYLWKYTRKAGRDAISQSRHRRFFWIHPYTRTLYWSDRDPQAAGGTELRAKSVAIEGVRVVTDENPMPPGLHRKSLLIITPGRTLKFTAPTSQRHEMWFNALTYLLLRDGQDGTVEEPSNLEDEDVREYSGYGAGRTMRGVTSLSSFRSRATGESLPSSSRNASSLSHRRPGEKERAQGSLSRLGNIFRSSSALGSYNSTGYDDADEAADEHHHHRHDGDGDRLENVRACCDGSNPSRPSRWLFYLANWLLGRHDVGTLSRKGGKKTSRSHKNGLHVHSHSHG